MFERFTQASRRVVVLAQEEARMLDHDHIGTEHLLLGLIHEESGIAARVLASAGITLEAARAQAGKMADPVGSPQMGHMPFTQRAKKVLELSLREALEQGKSYIGTEHILLGLTRDADWVGAQIINRLGGSLTALRQRVIDIEAASGAPADPVTEETPGPEAGLWNSPPGRALMRQVRAQSETVIGLRRLLASVDQRLAGIQRRLEVATEGDERAFTDLPRLLASVDQRLSSIERHLGIGPQPEAPRAEAE
jgi:ATP-dependent Clp protease ATP-binding subunit ClpC